jgi:hypothetical protein
MGLFTMLIFQNLLNLKKDCNTFPFDSEQYEKCIKLQKISADIFEKLQANYYQEFLLLQKLQEQEKFQQYMQTLEYFYTLIDSNLDNYISTIEQQEILKDLFNSFLNIGENDDFTPPE